MLIHNRVGDVIEFTLNLTIFSFFVFFPTGASSQEAIKELTKVNTDSLWTAYMEQGSTSEAVDDLIIRVQNELAKPTTIKGTSIDFWPDAVLRSIIFKFAEICKPASEQLRNRLGNLSPPIRDLTIIILGMQGDSTVKRDLRAIIETNDNPTARELATYSLAGFMDKKDIPIFKKALADTFWVTTHWDYVLEDGRDYETFYPVRDKAAEALRGMGFLVTHDFSGNYTILEEPK